MTFGFEFDQNDNFHGNSNVDCGVNNFGPFFASKVSNIDAITIEMNSKFQSLGRMFHHSPIVQKEFRDPYAHLCL